MSLGAHRRPVEARLTLGWYHCTRMVLEGRQISYDAYMEYKKTFNEERTLSYSSSDLYKKRQQDRDASLLDGLFWTGASVGVGSLLYQQGAKSKAISSLIHDMPLADLARRRLMKQFLDNKSAGIISGAIDPTHKGVQHLSLSLHSMVLGLEELSPLQLMKTLQLSSFSTLFVEMIEEQHKARHIRESSIRNFQEYYQKMILAESKIKLTDADMKAGFILENDRLYQAVIDDPQAGTYKKGKVLLNHARIVATGYGTGTTMSSNRIFEKFATHYGVDITRGQIEREGLAIVGGRTKEGVISKWTRSYGRFALELGAKSLDNPLGFVEEYINLGGGSKIFQSKYWQTAKRWTNLQLGSGGIYNISSREMVKRMARNLTVKGAAVTVGLYGADALLEHIAPKDSAWSNGVIAGLANTAMNAHIQFARIWNDNLQDLRRMQENAAPGSTSLTTLLGLPLAGAMLGANTAYFQRMYDTGRMGAHASGIKHTQEAVVDGVAGKILDKLGKNKATTILGRRSKVGALVGGALALPFLPGALAGKSSEELIAEYSGEKEVGVRENRLWLCVTPDTPMFTDKGLVFARDISEQHSLYNSIGTSVPVQRVHKRYAKEHVVKIIASLSPATPTSVTEDHEVLTQRGWVKAKDLCIDTDFLVAGVPKIFENVTQIDLGEYYKDGVVGDEIKAYQRINGEYRVINRTLCHRYLPVNYDTGLFLGWYLAEGSLHKRGISMSAIEISFHESEEEFAYNTTKTFLNSVGICKDFKAHRNQGKGKRIRVGSEPLARFLADFMYKGGCKVFPNIQNFGVDFVRGFLTGMFYGDGSISKQHGKRNRYTLKAKEIQHLVEYRRYCSFFGAYGGISLDRHSGAYCLQFSGESSHTLQKLGLRKENYKGEASHTVSRNATYIIKDGVVYLKISSLESFNYEGYVYDYTMGDIPEYTPSAFVIHNSGGNAYEGGQIKYHRDHLLRVLAKDAKVKTHYGDRRTMRDMNPIFSPFKYLQNPWKYEEMHVLDAPMPVWGMDTSYGSFLGQMFRGTVGQIIKPTTVNPYLEEQQGVLREALGFKAKTTRLAETIGLLMRDEDSKNPIEGGIIDDDAYITPEFEKKDVKSLIADGMMLRQNAPTNEPYVRAFQGTWSGTEEFVGLKGFTAGLITEDVLGVHPSTQLRPELEVSGSATNMSSHIQSLALGDALGSGEYLRRLFPQSASSKRDTVNPMRNQMNVEWLPSNETKYYKNFSRGNYFGSHTENGEYLLPGLEGFKVLNPELEKIAPNDMPLVYQYKILQNVARNSPEHLAIKEYLVKNQKLLSDAELEVFYEAYGQDEARSQLKKFSEYATESEKSKMGLFSAHNALWEFVSHRESTLEPLLPFRPAGKFLHQRSAIEDYKRTQMLGTDTGIWTNPKSHFIDPAINRTLNAASADYTPEEYKEKNRVDSYFDKLALIKADKEGSVYQSERNITALSFMGVRNARDMAKFKSALSEEQRAYVEAFSREKDPEKRNQIAQMLPTDIAAVYRSIWKNMDIYDGAVRRGIDPKEAINNAFLKDTKELSKVTGVTLTREEKREVRNKRYADKSWNENRKLQLIEEAKALRLKVAKEEAKRYVKEQTGMPGDDWIGFDPRLTIDDVKLKTLMIGREDIHKYGYWAQDVERVERLVALSEDTIPGDLEIIKKEKRENQAKVLALRERLRKSGFETTRIVTNSAPKQDLTITNTSEYLEDLYGDI